MILSVENSRKMKNNDEPISLQDFKDRKLNKRIVDDIVKILQILQMSQQALMFFRKYKPVQEIISVIETNKVLFELKKKKYEVKKP